jgi:hypothetical protein
MASDMMQHIPIELSENLDELRQQVIAQGGKPQSASFMSGELRARKAARQDFYQRQKENAKAQPQWYRDIGDFIIRGVRVVSVFVAGALLVLGLLVGTGVMIWAELQAVASGFDTIDPRYAGLYSVATVGFFLVILIVRETIVGRVDDEPRRMFSLRYAVRWLIYFIGFGKSWQPEYVKSRGLLVGIDSAIRLLMWTIIIFGLLGRLAEKMTMIETMAWMDGLRYVVEQSSLKDIFGYIGATVMTAALLYATHFIVHFIYEVYEQVTGGLGIDFLSQDSIEDYEQRAVVLYYQTEVLRLQTAQQKLQAPVTVYQNGHTLETMK